MPKEVKQSLNVSNSTEKKSFKDAIYIVSLGNTYGWFHPGRNGGSFGFSEPGEKLIDFYPRLKELYPNVHHIHFTSNRGLEEWLADRRVEILESQSKGAMIHKISTVSTLARRGLINNKRGGR